MDSCRPINGKGPIDANVVVLLDRPTVEAAKANKPLVGKGYKVLERWLRDYLSVGIEDCYLTLLVKVRVEDPPLCNPSHWMPSLLKELRMVKPGLIIAAGAESTRAMLQIKGSVKDYRGIVSKGLLDYLVFSIYSPTKKGVSESAVEAHFKQLTED